MHKTALKYTIETQNVVSSDNKAVQYRQIITITVCYWACFEAMHCFGEIYVIDSPVEVNTTAKRNIVTSRCSRRSISVASNEEEPPPNQNVLFRVDFNYIHSLKPYHAITNAKMTRSKHILVWGTVCKTMR